MLFLCINFDIYAYLSICYLTLNPPIKNYYFSQDASFWPALSITCLCKIPCLLIYIALLIATLYLARLSYSRTTSRKWPLPRGSTHRRISHRSMATGIPSPSRSWSVWRIWIAYLSFLQSSFPCTILFLYFFLEHKHKRKTRTLFAHEYRRIWDIQITFEKIYTLGSIDG